MKKTYTKLDYSPYMYDDTNIHTIKISDTIRSLTLVGDKYGAQNTLKDQLVEVNNIGTKVEELGADCFKDCTKLEHIHVPANVKFYRERSFKDISAEIDAPITRGETIFAIGENAFEGTSLTSVNIALSGKSIVDKNDPENGYQGCTLRSFDEGPYVGTYAFKDCKQLKSVRISEHPDIGTGMFQGCSSLSSVVFAQNFGACAGECAFKDCTALSSITFPEKWEIVSRNMFEGCSALTAVNFNTTSTSARLIDIEDSAFSGCKSLSSIVLPKSIDSLDALNDNAFTGSSLKKITFAGVSDSVFDAFKSQDEKYKALPEDYTTQSDFRYGVWYLNQCKPVIQYAIKNNIPLAIKCCGVGCGHCTSWDKMTFNTSAFKNETAKRPYLFLEMIYYMPDSNPAKATNENANCMYYFLDGREPGSKKETIKWSSRQHTFVILAAYWKKKDGTVVAQQWRTTGYGKDGETTKSYFNKLDTYFAGYERDTKFNSTAYTPAQYVSFNGWGLSSNCELRSSAGTQYTFDASAKTIVKGNTTITQIQQDRQAQFRTSTPERTRVVTVALDYAGTASSLPGMLQDATDIENLMSSYSSKITKLTNGNATVSKVKNAVKEAVEDPDCDLLIFHYSGHGGGGGNAKSYMALSGGNLQDSEFWKLIEHAKCRVLCIFACCHAGTMFKASADGSDGSSMSFSETTDFGKSAMEYFKQDEATGICAATDTPNLLVWSACKDSEVSWMYSTSEVRDRTDGITRTGHCMINHILSGFTAGMTYRQVWGLIPAEEQYFNANGTPYKYKGGYVYVHPQLTELGTSFQDFTAFT